jgi:predicted SprT family Zn-dependent metalloprotease
MAHTESDEVLAAAFLQHNAAKIAKHFGLRNRPKVYWTEDRRGHAVVGRNVVTLPSWAKYELEAFQTYYVAHEMSHFVQWQKSGKASHDREFKAIEDEALSLFDLEIVRRPRSHYPVMLSSTDGVLVWKENKWVGS